MTKNLTRGNPMRLILSFGIPILFGYLFQQLYNVVDTAIVGKTLGGAALAAVGSTGSVNFLVVGFCAGRVRRLRHSGGTAVRRRGREGAAPVCHRRGLADHSLRRGPHRRHAAAGRPRPHHHEHPRRTSTTGPTSTS